MKELLNVNQIRKTFSPGTINEKTALADVSLRMNEGDFITIIGNNGAGKSTLLNCIAGVFPIDSGSITLDGRDITKEPEYKRARQIGRVFQDPLKGTAFDMTIEQNLAIAYYKNRPRGLQPGISKKDRELFREKLALLGMGKDVIVACDFASAAETFRFLDQFTEEKPYVKIGMELYYAEGPQIVREIKARGHRIFLDRRGFYF